MLKQKYIKENWKKERGGGKKKKKKKKKDLIKLEQWVIHTDG